MKNLPNNKIYNISGTGFSFQGKVTGKDISLAREIATLGVINNEADVDEYKTIGDSIDIAFLVLGEKLGVDSFDRNIRPSYLNEYIGQKEVKENIEILKNEENTEKTIYDFDVVCICCYSMF